MIFEISICLLVEEFSNHLSLSICFIYSSCYLGMLRHYARFRNRRMGQAVGNAGIESHRIGVLLRCFIVLFTDFRGPLASGRLRGRLHRPGRFRTQDQTV